MISLTGGFVLLAALLHATWNAMLHGNRDRLMSMTWMSTAMAIISSAVAFVVPLPPLAAWPYIAMSGCVHVVYNFSLVHAYRRGDLGEAYPIARGSSPLLVTLGAALFAGEHISALRGTGIALVSGGVLALAFLGRRVTRAGALTAFATGALIAVYTVLDGIGVRLSGGRALSYSTWLFAFYWLMPLIITATQGARATWTPLRAAPKQAGRACIGGVVSLAAYGIVIWAMQTGAMGAVSALRETSVVFALLIGWGFLHERITALRLSACVVIAAGAVCLAR